MQEEPARSGGLLPLVRTGSDSAGWLGGKAKKCRSDPDSAAGLLCGLGPEPSPSRKSAADL